MPAGGTELRKEESGGVFCFALGCCLFLYLVTLLSNASLQRLLKPQPCPCLSCSGLPAALPPAALALVMLLVTKPLFLVKQSSSVLHMGDAGVKDQPSVSQPPRAAGLHGRQCGSSSNVFCLPPLSSLEGDFWDCPKWTMVGICVIRAEKGDMVLVTRHEHCGGPWSPLCS